MCAARILFLKDDAEEQIIAGGKFMSSEQQWELAHK